MNAEELLNLMKNRRSIRAFTEQDVSNEDIQKILEAARWCQSASNNQPWRFIVIRNKKIIEELARLAPYGKFIKSAPIIIAVVADTGKAPKWYLQDTSMVSHQICLMISALGLGTCWIGSLDRDAAAEHLKLKKKEYLTTILPVGHYKTNPSPTERKLLEDIVSYLD